MGEIGYEESIVIFFARIDLANLRLWPRSIPGTHPDTYSDINKDADSDLDSDQDAITDPDPIYNNDATPN